MKYVLANAQVFLNGGFSKKDLLISEDGIIADISPKLSVPSEAFVFDFNGCYIFPGFLDVHVHLREPGFSYKETIESGTAAAAHGGYTGICAMPNLNPYPDSAAHLEQELRIIEKTANVHVYPYACITKEERGEKPVDFRELAESAVAFSDDGRGVQSEEIMRYAMLQAKACGKIIAAHCEDNSLLDGGYIHKGSYCALHGHKGISSESEWRQIERDVQLAKETGCKYHVCHISTKESVSIIRQAKSDGVDITCETAPHYLLLTEADLQEDGRFKMNPPLRTEEDRCALIEGILDGTVDMIATDHAPHSQEEKSKGLRDSLMGIVGLETAFPLLYTYLVKKGIISLDKLVNLMFLSPHRRFDIGHCFRIGEPADLTVFDLDRRYRIEPDWFLSKGRSTPFDGYHVYGACKLTLVNGRIAWKESLTEK